MNAINRDLLIGIASIVFSICAGFWTLFNYYMSQEKSKLDAVISITEKIEWVKLKQLEINKIERDKNGIDNIDEKRDKEEEKKRKVYELLSEVRYRYTQIKRPFLTDKKNWQQSWSEFHDYIESAYTDSFKTYEDDIDDAWKKILKYSKIPTIK